MGYSLIQLRIEDQLKTQANKLFDNLGLDMSTAIRIFLKRAVATGSIPFELKDSTFKAEAALKAVMELNEEAHKNGTAGMPDYMVAEEIAEYRASKRNE